MRVTPRHTPHSQFHPVPLPKERKRIAEEARDEAKRVLRLDHYVLQQPREQIQPIRQVNIRRIHERVVDGLPQSLPYPAQDTPLGNLLRTLTGDVILFYARTMNRLDQEHNVAEEI